MVMGDKWMNIGFEDDELLPYLEPVYDINDQTRIRELGVYVHVYSHTCMPLYYTCTSNIILSRNVNNSFV